MYNTPAMITIIANMSADNNDLFIIKL